MDWPTAPEVTAAIADAVEREEFGYARPDADTGLPDALAAWARHRWGWTIDPARVHLVPDVLKGVELALDCFGEPGSPIVLPTPAYMPFFEVVNVVGRPMVEVPLLEHDGYRTLDLDGIDAAFAGGAGSLILCQPYNPLGRRFTAEELAGVAEVVGRHEARVVSDEIHASLTYDAPHVPYASVSELAASHAVTVTSASKAWNLPGLKCAQVIVNNDADEQVWSQISNLRTHGASTIGIEANVAAYRFGEAWLDKCLGWLDANRHLLAELLADQLPQVRYTVPEGTYLAWLDFSELDLPDEPASFFLEHAKVAMNPGKAFGGNGDACARLNFATSPDIVEEAVIAMAKAVRSRHR